MRTVFLAALAAYALLIAWGFTTAHAAEPQRGPAALPREQRAVLDGRIVPAGRFLAADQQAAEKGLSA